MASHSDISCRLLIDPRAGGAWNMAVDEALLESAALENRLTLRFYRWSEPALSLGYFQRYDDRRMHPASSACACVRRSTGGGAILHDRELTYSIAVPPTHVLARTTQELYQAMHGSLVECLRRWGFDALLAVTRARRANASTLATSRAEPFLCFDRHTAGDVIIGSHKIVGSAQRRWRGAVLQHGSLLLAASPAAPELLGLNDLAGTQLAVDDIIARWREVLPAILGVGFCSDELTAEEHSQAAKIAQGKYGHSSWTQRR
jgi:lipoate-protein ligase A